MFIKVEPSGTSLVVSGLCASTSQALPGSARRFLYLGPAPHLSEHDLDTHGVPGSDET